MTVPRKPRPGERTPNVGESVRLCDPDPESDVWGVVVTVGRSRPGNVPVAAVRWNVLPPWVCRPGSRAGTETLEVVTCLSQERPR